MPKYIFKHQPSVIFYVCDCLEELKLIRSVQIEALKEVGVTEVVLAINYRPEVEITEQLLSQLGLASMI